MYRSFNAVAGLIIAIIVVVLVLAVRESWDEGHYDGPVIGQVVKKVYDDPDEWTTCHSVGSIGQPGYNSCGYTTIDHDPAHWWLLLDDGDKRDEFSVSESEFANVSVGQWFDTENRRVMPR